MFSAEGFDIIDSKKLTQEEKFGYIEKKAKGVADFEDQYCRGRKQSNEC